MSAYRAKVRDVTRHLLKRAMDLLLSSVAIVLFAPLLSVIALIVKLTSKGPILSRQLRRGQFDRPFLLLKFRTRHERRDLGFTVPQLRTVNSIHPLALNPPTTMVGRFLRRTSLEELPQFLNVMKGEMSMVGPRPLPFEYPSSRTRAQAKPGITCLWQISGSETLDDMFRLDNEYASSFNLWLDMKLLLRTIPAALISTDRITRPPGALIGRWAEFVFSPRTVEYLVNPILADIQIEYFNALAEGRNAKAVWVRLRGYWNLITVVGFAGFLRTVLSFWEILK